MREPVAIEYRVFIRKVQRARTHELGNERRLAGEAVAGQHDSVAADFAARSAIRMMRKGSKNSDMESSGAGLTGQVPLRLRA